MENVVDAIRAALAADATPEARNAGVQACHAVLAALQARAGEPLAAPRPIDLGPTAAAVAAIVRNTPPDQLLDLAIAKLRTLVPADAQPTTRPLMIRFVPVPRP